MKRLYMMYEEFIIQPTMLEEDENKVVETKALPYLLDK